MCCISAGPDNDIILGFLCVLSAIIICIIYWFSERIATNKSKYNIIMPIMSALFLIFSAIIDEYFANPFSNFPEYCIIALDASSIIAALFSIFSSTKFLKDKPLLSNKVSSIVGVITITASCVLGYFSYINFIKPNTIFISPLFYIPFLYLLLFLAIMAFQGRNNKENFKISIICLILCLTLRFVLPYTISMIQKCDIKLGHNFSFFEKLNISLPISNIETINDETTLIQDKETITDETTIPYFILPMRESNLKNELSLLIDRGFVNGSVRVMRFALSDTDCDIDYDPNKITFSDSCLVSKNLDFSLEYNDNSYRLYDNDHKLTLISYDDLIVYTEDETIIDDFPGFNVFLLNQVDSSLITGEVKP